MNGRAPLWSRCAVVFALLAPAGCAAATIEPPGDRTGRELSTVDPTTLPGPITASVGSTAPGPNSTPSAATGPIAVENFDGGQLDAGRWKVYDAAATNGISRWSPDMVRVTGGELQITGVGHDPTGAGNVSGGLCWCRGGGARTYGRWQIRARFEAGIGYGQAILLWPTSERWPDDGEIDIVETPTAAKLTADGTVHWGTSAHPAEDSGRIAGDFTAWHTYTVDWRPGFVKLSVDDRLLYDSTRGSGAATIPSTPMSLALQQEPGPFGTNWVPAPTSATPARVTMHVDWIKLYR